MPTRYYFAYGSNISREQMSQRCPSAVAIGLGLLTGFEFIINERGVATLLRKENEIVQGLVWELTTQCESSLDVYEGVKFGTYLKEEVPITLRNLTEKDNCLVYIASNYLRGGPRQGYLERIIAAARSEGFENRYIESMQRWLTET